MLCSVTTFVVFHFLLLSSFCEVVWFFKAGLHNPILSNGKAVIAKTKVAKEFLPFCNLVVESQRLLSGMAKCYHKRIRGCAVHAAKRIWDQMIEASQNSAVSADEIADPAIIRT